MSNKKKKLFLEILLLFPNNEFESSFLKVMQLIKQGDSKVDQSIMELANGTILVECYDWSKKYRYADKLIISIRSTELKNFLMTAYN